MYILRYFLSVVLFFISINMVSAAHKPEVPTLTLYDISSPPTLDPTFSDDPTSQMVIDNLFEKLIERDLEGKITAGVAVSWKNKDNKIWTFKLRKNAKWSDGKPVTAHDFVYAIRRTVDPKVASPLAGRYMTIGYKNAVEIVNGNISVKELGVKAIDDYTLEITLEKPVPYFIEIAGIAPLRKDVVEKYGDKWTNVGKFIGNGAYKLEEFILQEKIILKKNPYYWDQKNVQIEKVNFLVITDTAVAYSRYMANELDIVFVNTPRSLYEKAKKTYPNELYQVPRASVSYIGINQDKISDKRVRKALQLGLDREIIAKHVLGAGYRPAYNFVPPSIKHANFSKPDWSEWSDQQRYAEAKRLLAAAGYNEQNPYKFTLYYDTSETGKLLAVAVQSMYKKNIGVEVSINNLEWKTLLQRKADSELESFFTGKYPQYNDPLSFLLDAISYSTYNDVRYKNLVYDRLVEISYYVTNVAERRDLLEYADKLLIEDVVYIPIYFPVANVLVKPWVKGYGKNPFGRPRVSLMSVTMSERAKARNR